MTREQILQMQASARIYQKLYDDAYASWRMRAPAPTYNDSVDAISDYRRTEAVRSKKLLPMTETRAAPGEPTFAQLRRTKYWELDDQAFSVMEDHLLRAVAAAGKRNDSVAWGDPLREIHERGENGEHVIRFLGERSFVHDMKSVPRRVVYFMRRALPKVWKNYPPANKGFGRKVSSCPMRGPHRDLLTATAGVLIGDC